MQHLSNRTTSNTDYFGRLFKDTKITVRFPKRHICKTNEINTLFPIFNNNELGNFKVRPNHTILIGIEDVLCEVLSSLNAMNLVTQNYQKKWLFHEYLPLKWFLFWKGSCIITYSGEKYLSSRSSSLEEVLLPRSTYKKEIAAPDN